MRAALHPVFRHARGPISPLLSAPLSFPLSSLASSLASSPPPSTFLERAEQYVAWDPNPSTRSYVSDLLNHHPTTPPSAPAACAFSSERLADLFSARLAFGTAGLRAPFGPGYSQMNDLTVIQTAQGLLSYLLSTMPLPELQLRGLVVGFDHRSSSSFTPFDLSSRSFANLTAAVFAERAVPCYLFPDFVATPLVPFAVAHHGAAAGVMVTASHNPPQDTGTRAGPTATRHPPSLTAPKSKSPPTYPDPGYKVYWGNGAQIIPPHDAGIASHITQNLEPWSASFSSSPPPTSPLLLPTEHLAPLYFEQMRSKLCRRPSSNSSSDSRITYTAMHGVGHDFSKRSFEAFSLPPYIPTLSQQAPDPGFPTVAFPNPEEGEGALAEAILAAESAGSRVIVANDPDADRLAVAERQAGGEWRLFTGNEIGAVLGHWQYSRASGSGPIAMLASTVSSKFLR
jgi:phosphomannomutase